MDKTNVATADERSISGNTQPAPREKDDDKNLENQDWYHGYRPRRDIKKIIHEPGEFLVRATDNKRDSTAIIISVMDVNRKLLHITVNCDDKKRWHLIGTKKASSPAAGRTFETVADLIAHYRAKGISRKLALKTPVSRPQWMMKHEQITYAESDKLGSGNFCHVYKGKLKQKNETVAIKISQSAQNAAADTEEAKEARRDMLSEARIMSHYVHDNVIRFFGVACDHVPILVVMEFCPGGDLQTHLEKQSSKIDKPERVLYCLEAARGMSYLHSRSCIHRDLAARNCLISERGVVKIADFGLSKMLSDDDKDDGEEKEAEKPVGAAQVPVRWMAPESLSKAHIFTQMSDVWAFGVMLYEIFNNGGKPWPNDPPKFVATEIRKCRMPTLPEGTPPQVKELVATIWVHNPEERPQMSRILTSLSLIYRDNPVKHPEHMTINSLKGVKREAIREEDFTDSSCSADETSIIEESPFTPRSKNSTSNAKTPKRADKGKRRIGSARSKTKGAF